MYRIAIFEVPTEVIGEFIEKLTDLELENSIIGKNEDEEIEIKVTYEKDESHVVEELETFLETLIYGIEESAEERNDQ